MDVDRKFWFVFGMLFYIGGVSALSTAAWRVSTTAALVLGLFCEFHRYLEPIQAHMLPVVVNACNGVGVMLFMLFTLLVQSLQKENPVYTVVSVSALTMSFFCVLMVLRPVITDFGILYALCLITVNLSAEEFGVGWPTLLVLAVSLPLLVALQFLVLLDIHANVQVAQQAGGN